MTAPSKPWAKAKEVLLIPPPNEIYIYLFLEAYQHANDHHNNFPKKQLLPTLEKYLWIM